MPRDRNTFLKVQREAEKKRKAAEKRARRQKKKEASLESESRTDVVGDPPAEEE